MSIPKKIHYCWFGGNEKPALAEKCIKGWKKKCAGYEIIEWNESNYDIASAPLYVRQAYEAKKWAFVTDYVRLQVVYEHGGIYLDTDVKVIRPLNKMLAYHAYFGFEDGKNINTGLGFGAEKGSPILKELIDDYQDIPFIKEDGSLDLTSCPERNTLIFLRHGLKQDDSLQILEGNICVLPNEYLCPIDYTTGVKKITKRTLSIHLFQASWHTEEERNRHKEEIRRKKKQIRKEFIRYLPNHIMLGILGQKRYDAIKKKINKG